MMASGARAQSASIGRAIRATRARIAAGRVALQGNLDPVALFAPPEQRARGRAPRARRIRPAPGHVFNLGHGILPETPIDSVAALVDEVRTYSRSTRAPRSRLRLTYAQISFGSGDIPGSLVFHWLRALVSH